MGEINTGTRVPRKYVLGVHTSLGGTLILQVQEDFLKHRSGSGGFRQRSPNVLAPATGFVEDNFSADWGGGGRDGSHANASDGEWQMKLPAARPSS